MLTCIIWNFVWILSKIRICKSMMEGLWLIFRIIACLMTAWIRHLQGTNESHCQSSLSFNLLRPAWSHKALHRLFVLHLTKFIQMITLDSIVPSSLLFVSMMWPFAWVKVYYKQYNRFNMIYEFSWLCLLSVICGLYIQIPRMHSNSYVLFGWFWLSMINVHSFHFLSPWSNLIP